MRALAWVALAVLVGVYLCAPIRDADLWWHIAVGRWILAHQTVPTVDLWNSFGAGSAWRAYSWSSEAIYAFVEGRFGERGLMVLQMALGVALAGVAQLAFSAISRSFLVGAALGAYATLSSYAHFALRPQSLVWVFFIAALMIADSVARSGRSWRRLAAATLVGCLWANTHLSAVIGLVSIALWSWSGARPRAALDSALLVGAFLFGTLLTPYLGGEWSTLFEKSDHVLAFTSIREFGAASFGHHSTILALLGVVLLAACGATSGGLPNPARLTLVALLLLSGLIVVKFLPFAVFGICALLADWWREWGARSDSKLVEGVRRFEGVWNRLEPNTVGAIVFMLGALVFLHGAKLYRHPVERASVPKEAVDFIESKGLQQPVLNEFSVGGYLIYRWSDQSGVPRHLVSIDGRTNVNPPRVWEAYRAAFTGDERWEEYLDLVRPKSVLWRRGSPLNSILLESPAWCRVFDGGHPRAPYVVFITREEFDARRGEFESSDCS